MSPDSLEASGTGSLELAAEPVRLCPKLEHEWNRHGNGAAMKGRWVIKILPPARQLTIEGEKRLQRKSGVSGGFIAGSVAQVW